MEKEISKTGERGDIPFSSPSPPLPFFDYAGDLGLDTFRPSDLEIRRRMMSRLRHSDLLTDLHHHQDLLDRQTATLSYMEEAAKEAQALREENISLKMVNEELTNRLSLLLRATSEYAASVGLSVSGPGPGLGSDSDSDLSSLVHRLGRMGSMSLMERPSLDTVMNSDPVEGSENAEVDRVSLPKSISVRSDRNLKNVQTGGSSGGQVYKLNECNKKTAM